MSLVELFFSFDGRINRADFWFGIAALVSVAMAAAMLDVSQIGEIGLFYYTSLVLTFLPHLALNVKRSHDRNHTGWFVILAFIPVICIAYFIEVSLIKGTAGSNRFGLDPTESEMTGK